MDEIHQRLVARIRCLANKRGVALSHLPDFANVGRSHYWEVLQGRSSPTLEWVQKIAAALEVDVVDLLARPDDAASQL